MYIQLPIHIYHNTLEHFEKDISVLIKWLMVQMFFSGVVSEKLESVASFSTTPISFWFAKWNHPF